MTKDAELVETVRRDLSHPVSEEESRKARTRLFWDAAGGVLITVAWVLYRAFVDDGRDLWVPPFMMAVVIATNTVRQYRIVRPRPATPVPDDVLAWHVKQFTRCFSCRAVIKVMTLECPKCGAFLAARVLLVACLLGALCVFLFWLSLT